ncbi:MAG: hypothetical protein K8S27_01470 [Candidatus Omnitrophica bacterium]|nr:hypothetical protein [Candidatus Omnitrophota bacterium]
MVEFDQWREAIIFCSIVGIIVVIPCFLTAKMSIKMIDQLGRYPSKTPSIIMSMCIPFSVLVFLTYFFLLLFYHFFSS